MKVFLQSIVAQLLLNPYVFWRGYQALPPCKGWRVSYTLLFVLELLLYFVGFFFYKELPDEWLVPLMFVCNTWYIACLYITLSLLVLEGLRLLNRWWHWYPAWLSARWQQVKLTLFFLILLAVTLLMVHANHVVNYPSVTHVNITIPKQAAGRDSLTIVMMSDLHIGEMIGKKLVQRYVALSNAQHPDMVVLVGDIMDYESRFAEKEHIEDDLQQLKAPLGVYIVNGNHEYRANRFAKRRWLQKTGGILLIDSVVMPDSSFYLIGRDDRINRKRAALHTLMAGLDTTKPLLLLDHQPLSFNEMLMNRIDFGMHGHTHNGQFWPYPLVMKLVYECPYGYYRKGDTQFYVSSGIGIAGPPYRVGTASELVVLHIHFSPNPVGHHAL
ncbi:MAG: metallophosphoesterase [Tannerellaceae bacterium]